MDIKTVMDREAATMAVSGSLNTNTSRELEEELERVMSSATSVTLDLADLEYISSAGLRVVLGAQKRLGAGNLTLKNVQESVQEVLEITGLSDILTIE